MDFQHTTIHLNKQKKIGSVIFVVEGQRDSNIIKRIFNEILDYQLERLLKKQEYELFTSQYHRHSRVFVINTENSNIKSISKTNPDDYLYSIYNKLNSEYQFDVRNSRLYYIYDRDHRSNNNPELIRTYLKEFNNAHSDDHSFNEIGGLLLLNYPSSEAFTITCFNSDQKIQFKYGNEAKAFIGRSGYQLNQVKDTHLTQAASFLFERLDHWGIAFDLDRLEQTTYPIFEFEEYYFNCNDAYLLVSQITIALIDLGILELIDY